MNVGNGGSSKRFVKRNSPSLASVFIASVRVFAL